jgi:hypothetical protein
MAISSSETETAAAPVAEVPVAEKIDSSPADATSEPAPAEASKPVSRQLSATPHVQALDPRAPRRARTSPQPTSALTHPCPMQCAPPAPTHSRHL